MKDPENSSIVTPLYGTPVLVFYSNIEISEQVRKYLQTVFHSAADDPAISQSVFTINHGEGSY